MTKIGQELINSANQALAFARGDMYRTIEPINTDAECPIIPVHDMGGLQ